jgi:hypothetical protein
VGGQAWYRRLFLRGQAPARARRSLSTSQIYILTFQRRPLKAFTSWEGANEEMAGYSAGRQKEMKVAIVELVNDDKS